MMKNYLLLVVAIAMASTPASATSLFMSLDSPTLTGAPGDVLQFSGTLTNTTGADLYLNADSFTLAGFDPSAIDDSPFFTNAPLFLSAGASTGDIGLFNITIPSVFATNSYVGSFEILGGATANDQTIIGSVDFTVQVQPAGVPEPSASSLMLLGGALAFSLRKRLRSRLT